MNQTRRERSFYLLEQLKEVEEIDLPVENPRCHHVYQMFTIKVNPGIRDDMIFYLKKRGIEASVHFDPPVHEHPAYLTSNNRRLSVTEQVARSIITLPMFPQLTQQQLDQMVSSIKDYFVYG